MTIKEYRKKHGITQEELAKQAGVSVFTIRSLENRKRSIGSITVDSAVRLSKFMGITVDEFIGKRLEIDCGMLYEKDLEWYKGE